MKFIKYLFLLFMVTTLSRCGVYSFSGGSVGEAKTINITYFPNNASFVEPTLSQKITEALREKFLQQTNLNLVNDDADLTFEGEVTQYRISPTSATADNRASQNRLTITVKVKFFNRLEEDKNFDKSFSHFYDYDANALLTGATLEEAYTIIFERITQDIFNASVAQW